MACHEKLALPIQHFRDSPRNGCSIYVNIEDIQKYADPGFRRGELFDRDNFAVSGRHDRISTRRSTLRIPEEIQTKSRNNVERNPQPWMDEVPEDQAHGRGSRCVVKTIRNNAQDSILSWLYRSLSGTAIPGAKQSSKERYQHWTMLSNELGISRRHLIGAGTAGIATREEGGPAPEDES